MHHGINIAKCKSNECVLKCFGDATSLFFWKIGKHISSKFMNGWNFSVFQCVMITIIRNWTILTMQTIGHSGNMTMQPNYMYIEVLEKTMTSDIFWNLLTMSSVK